MITELSPALANIAVQIEPKDLLLTKGAWVRFSDKWQGTGHRDWFRDHKTNKGNTFVVSETPTLLHYDSSYIIPGSDTADSGDYKDITLDNSTNGLKLYPEKEYTIYQVGVGMKEGNYMVHTYIPQNNYLYKLGYTSMYPDVTDDDMLYLGRKDPEDSPYNTPLWFLYFIKEMPAFVLRLFMKSGVDFDKVTLGWWMNKCKVEEIETPTMEQRERALYLPWYSEFSEY